MGQWLKNAWSKFSAWAGPALKRAWEYVAPAAKSMAAAEFQRETDELQAKVNIVFAEHGVPGINRAFDQWQAKLSAWVNKTPLPAGLKSRLLEIVQERGDQGQALIVKAAQEGGMPAANLAFDRFQESISEKIKAL